MCQCQWNKQISLASLLSFSFYLSAHSYDVYEIFANAFKLFFFFASNYHTQGMNEVMEWKREKLMTS